MVSISMLFAALVAIQLLQCSTAAPALWTPVKSETRDGVNNLVHEVERQHFREARNTIGNGNVHNYALTTFKSLSNWKKNNCDMNDQCETVSRHWCNGSLPKKMFCSQDGYYNGSSFCAINFQLVVGSENSTIHGMDVSLYKKQDDRDTHYHMYLISEVEPNFIDTVSYRTIHSNCSGWQTFHINPKKLEHMQEQLYWTPKNDDNTYILSATMTMVVFAQDNNQMMYDRTLSCDEIASLFVLDKTSPPAPPQREEPLNSHDAEDKGDSASTTELTNKDTHTKTKPTGSGEAISSEMAIENSNNDDVSQAPESEEPAEETLDVEVLVPLATLFIDDIDAFSVLRGKREASSELGSEWSETSGDGPLPSPMEELCELRVKNVSFNDYRILIPATFEQGYCVTPPSLSSRGHWCVPSSFQSMHILKQDDYGLSIELIPDFIVNGCSPSCKLQSKVVNLEEHFNISESTIRIVVPQTVDVQQCVLSPSGGSEDYQCMPATYEDIDVIILRTESGRVSIDRIPNVIVASCKVTMRENKLVITDSTVPSTTASPTTATTTVIPTKEEETEKEDEDVEKTTAITATTDKQVHSNNDCELRDKIVNFEEPWILAPLSVNVKECVFSGTTDTNVQCVAATYAPLPLLVRNEEQIQIETLTDVVVSSCKIMTIMPEEDEVVEEESKKEGEEEEEKKTKDSSDMDEQPTSRYVSCELQDRVVNVTEYIGDDSIIAPQMFNIRQCSPSTSSDQQCVQCEPLYGRLEVLQRIPTPHGSEILITVIEGVVVTGCRRNPNC